MRQALMLPKRSSNIPKLYTTIYLPYRISLKDSSACFQFFLVKKKHNKTSLPAWKQFVLSFRGNCSTLGLQHPSAVLFFLLSGFKSAEHSVKQRLTPSSSSSELSKMLSRSWSDGARSVTCVRLPEPTRPAALSCRVSIRKRGNNQ